MTREEQAIEYIKKYRELDENLYNTAPKGTVSSIATKKCLEFWDMAISALEKQNIYDDGEHYVTISKALYDRMNTELESINECTCCEYRVGGECCYAEVEPCEDAVSRQDAIAKIQENYKLAESMGELAVMDEESIKHLPPVTPVTEDAVSRGVFEQVMWERDIAIEQLHELGYELGQKIEPCDAVSREAILKKQYRIDDSATLSTRDVVNVEDIEDAPSVTVRQCSLYSVSEDGRGLCALLEENPDDTPLAKERQLPPVTVRQTGEWINVTNGRGGHECSLCHEYAPSYQDGDEWLTKFCPNCGKRMVEPQERSDKE